VEGVDGEGEQLDLTKRNKFCLSAIDVGAAGEGVSEGSAEKVWGGVWDGWLQARRLTMYETRVAA